MKEYFQLFLPLRIFLFPITLLQPRIPSVLLSINSLTSVYKSIYLTLAQVQQAASQCLSRGSFQSCAMPSSYPGQLLQKDSQLFVPLYFVLSPVSLSFLQLQFYKNDFSENLRGPASRSKNTSLLIVFDNTGYYHVQLQTVFSLQSGSSPLFRSPHISPFEFRDGLRQAFSLLFSPGSILFLSSLPFSRFHSHSTQILLLWLHLQLYTAVRTQRSVDVCEP